MACARHVEADCLSVPSEINVPSRSAVGLGVISLPLPLPFNVAPVACLGEQECSFISLGELVPQGALMINIECQGDGAKRATASAEGTFISLGTDPTPWLMHCRERETASSSAPTSMWAGKRGWCTANLLQVRSRAACARRLLFLAWDGRWGANERSPCCG